MKVQLVASVESVVIVVLYPRIPVLCLSCE
jgi:hypothetical protein